MTRILFMIMVLISLSVFAVDIIPVTSWPKTIHAPDKLITGATIMDCVKYGYRLLTTKPATPEDKRIKSETIIQDDKDPTKCKYDIAYEDIPEPIIPAPPPPEILTNIAHDRVSFSFTTNGTFRSVVWIDAPVTNVTESE